MAVDGVLFTEQVEEVVVAVRIRGQRVHARGEVAPLAIG
jgi:hypothetical protein